MRRSRNASNRKRRVLDSVTKCSDCYKSTANNVGHHAWNPGMNGIPGEAPSLQVKK